MPACPEPTELLLLVLIVLVLDRVAPPRAPKASIVLRPTSRARVEEEEEEEEEEEVVVVVVEDEGFFSVLVFELKARGFGPFGPTPPPPLLLLPPPTPPPPPSLRAFHTLTWASIVCALINPAAALVPPPAKLKAPHHLACEKKGGGEGEREGC